MVNLNMKVLFLNNYYYVRGGSERVFHDEMSMLEGRGHQVASFCRAHPSDPVHPYSRFSPEHVETQSISPSIEGFKTIVGLVYSKRVREKLSNFLASHPVDIAHCHNIYGRLTSSVLDELEKRRIPTVLTLHDYKLICPSYKLENGGVICEDCRGLKFRHAIKNRCHKNSLIASGIYSFESYFSHFRKSYTRKVSRLISPSRFLRDKFVEFGWDTRQIEVVPNFLDTDAFEPRFAKGDYFLYLGRLSAEKGVVTLLEAISGLAAGAKLVVAGTGPLEDELKERFGGLDAVSFAGYLSGKKLQDAIRGALAVVIPSEWYENAPMSVLEAMAYGKPVIAARIGGIPEMVHDNETGFLFESGDVDDLRGKLAGMRSLPSSTVEDMGHAARTFVEENHSKELHYNKLMAVYRDAQGRSKSQQAG